jgi:hypothetical protein
MKKKNRDKMTKGLVFFVVIIFIITLIPMFFGK